MSVIKDTFVKHWPWIVGGGVVIGLGMKFLSTTEAEQVASSGSGSTSGDTASSSFDPAYINAVSAANVAQSQVQQGALIAQAQIQALASDAATKQVEAQASIITANANLALANGQSNALAMQAQADQYEALANGQAAITTANAAYKVAEGQSYATAMTGDANYALAMAQGYAGITAAQGEATYQQYHGAAELTTAQGQAAFQNYAGQSILLDSINAPQMAFITGSFAANQTAIQAAAIASASAQQGVMSISNNALNLSPALMGQSGIAQIAISGQQTASATTMSNYGNFAQVFSDIWGGAGKTAALAG